MKIFKETLLIALALASLIGSFVALVIIPENPTLWLSGIGLFTSVASLLIYEKRRQLLFWWENTHKKKWLATLLTFGILTVAVGLTNYIAYKRPLFRDFSRGQWMSLGSESLALIKKISEKNVPITFFIVGKKDQFPAIRELVELYRLENPAFRIELIDSELKPQWLKEWNISVLPSVALLYGEKKIVAEEVSEWGISAQLKKQLDFKQKSVAIVKDIALFNSSEELVEEGQSKMLRFLERSDYKMTQIDLLAIDGKELLNFDVVMLLSPLEKINPETAEKLKSYIAMPEKIFVLALDAVTEKDFIQTWQTHLLDFIQIEWLPGHIVDHQSSIQGSQGSVPLVTSLKEEEVSKGFRGALFFPLPPAINFAQNAENISEWKVIATTTNQGEHFLEWSDLEKKKAVTSDRIKKEWPMFAWRPGNLNQGHVIFAGSGRLWQNQYADYAQHFHLLINTLEFSSGQKELMSFSRPDYNEQPRVLGQHEKMLVSMGMIFVLPFLLGLCSLLTFRRGVQA